MKQDDAPVNEMAADMRSGGRGIENLSESNASNGSGEMASSGGDLTRANVPVEERGGGRRVPIPTDCSGFVAVGFGGAGCVYRAWSWSRGC